MLIHKDKLFVAKGERGINIYSLNPTNKPIANSLSIKRDSSYYLPTTSLSYGHNLLFSVHKKNLTILEPKGNDAIFLSRLHTERFDVNISSIYVDEKLPYIYVGLENKGLVVYSINDRSVKYDYTNNIKDVQSIFSTIDSLYLMSKDNNGTLTVYKKIFIGENLKLNEAFTQDNLHDIRILDIKNNKLSYINEANDSVGIYNISSEDDSISFDFSIEHNDSKLPKELNNNINNLNDFYYDGFYRVISSDYGLVILDDDNNEPFQDLTFYSHKIAVYNDFIISTDDVKEDINKGIDNSSGLRIYKFGDISVSKNYGRAPLKVQFELRSLNLYRVAWNFTPLEFPSYEKAPYFIYKKHGDYNVSTTITYNSGKVVKEYIPIKVTKDRKIEVSLSANSVAGNAPFDLIVDLSNTDVSLIKKISWNVLRDGNISLLTDRRVDSLKYTFMDSGHYIVKVNIEDFENNMVEKNISIKVETYFKPEIVLDLNRTYMAKDINFSLIYKDSIDDTNHTSERNITNYKWVFHDGAVSYQKNAIYNYPKVGTYPISAIIKDEYNITYEINKTIEISSSILPNIITTKKVAESPFSTTFSLVLENNYNRHISDLIWELPNGSKSKVSSLAYTFNNEGEFKIKNRYTLSDGFSGIDEVSVKIDNTVDTNITSSVDYGFAPLKVDFYISGIAHSGIKSYSVEYGDGNASKFDFNETKFSYTFEKAKLYQVKVVAKSNKNHQGMGYKKIYAIDVNLSYELLEKDLDKIAQSKELKVQFEAKITDDTFVKSYQWFYGYETAKSDINESKPTYIYKFNKDYKAQFEITLNNNQKITKEIIIKYPTSKGNIELFRGWNLISNPLSLPLVKGCLSTTKCIKMSKLENPSIIWILKDNKWEKNPQTIPSKYGIWIKVNSNKELSFYGNRFNLDINNIPVNSWHLLGNGKDLVASDLSSFKVLYIYDSKTQKYTKNPTSIKASKGFYGIK